MRKPNGYGSIKHLSGRRRRPFVFVVSEAGRQRPVEYFVTQTEAEIFAIEARQSILKLTGKATCHCCFVDSVLIHCLSAYGIPISIFGGAVADDG